MTTPSAPTADEAAAAPPDSHRRRAAHLYGLVIAGSVLAAAPTDIGLVRVAALLGGTLVVYWAAESYAHLIATRTILRRRLTHPELRGVLRDGFPLVVACLVPGAVLVVEAILQVDPTTGVRVAQVVNLALLGVVGWRMSTVSGMVGLRRLGATAVCCLLGLAMIGLKLGLQH